MRVGVILVAIALAQGRPAFERTVDRNSVERIANKAIDSKADKQRSPVWPELFTNRPVEHRLRERSTSRAITAFERTKETNEKSNRKPIVWRFNSYGQVELDAPIDPNAQIEIDNGQIRCLGLQCMRILFKIEPMIATCE